MKHIAVLASGGGTNFQALIDACKSGEIDAKIALLIYNRKDAYAKIRAEENHIETKYINRVQLGSVEKMQEEVFEALQKANVDVIVLAGYLEKLSSEVIEKYENKIINTHPSLIPMFCGKGFYGGNVHQAVIDAGIKVSGCTIHLVDAHYDTGPIIMQQPVEVKQGDDAISLAKRILPYEHRCLVESVKLLCSELIDVIDNKVIINKKNLSNHN